MSKITDFKLNVFSGLVVWYKGCEWLGVAGTHHIEPIPNFLQFGRFIEGKTGS